MVKNAKNPWSLQMFPPSLGIKWERLAKSTRSISGPPRCVGCLCGCRACAQPRGARGRSKNPADADVESWNEMENPRGLSENWMIPSGYVKIAMENGHIVDFPMKNGGSFNSYVTVYQRVTYIRIYSNDDDLQLIDFYPITVELDFFFFQSQCR